MSFPRFINIAIFIVLINISTHISLFYHNHKSYNDLLCPKRQKGKRNKKRFITLENISCRKQSFLYSAD